MIHEDTFALLDIRIMLAMLYKFVQAKGPQTEIAKSPTPSPHPI